MTNPADYYKKPEELQAKLESSEQLTRLDITELLLQVRDEAVVVFRATKSNDRSFYTRYRNFLEMFYKLYGSLKYNVPLTKKVPEWDKQIPIIERLFNMWDRCPASIMLGYWDWVWSVCVRTGIYNLTKETYIARQGGSWAEEVAGKVTPEEELEDEELVE